MQQVGPVGITKVYRNAQCESPDRPVNTICSRMSITGMHYKPRYLFFVADPGFPVGVNPMVLDIAATLKTMQES